jgi:hypothetical protein
MTRRCDAQCQWGDYSACLQGCSPGAVENGDPCGDCGHQERTCNVDCTWSAWSCVDEGVCSEGQVEYGSVCGNCGRQKRVCQSNCSWGAWSCVDQGVCSESDTSACPTCPSTPTAFRRCTSACIWGPCEFRIEPQVEVAPTSGTCGVTTFSQPGWGFTPNKTAQLHFVVGAGQACSQEYVVNVAVNSCGRYSRSYSPASNFACPGQVQYWAKDVTSNQNSNTFLFFVSCP